VRNNINVVLNNLLELAMYTRGWNGVLNEFPIEEAIVENQNIVDIAVTESLNKYENSVRGLPSDISCCFAGLPLLKYQHKKFIVINDTDNGKSLGERIEIMKSGENIQNVNSCIRLTSNYLSASVYRYYQALRLPVPFDIDRLRYIS
jgi:hypothetical protein